MERIKPKYQILKEYLVDRINHLELKTGDRVESENALSERFHISRHTVRRAISQLVNEGRLETIQGKGTFVADVRRKAFHQGQIIGVMTTYLSDYIFPSIIRGIDQVVSKNGYNIVLCCTDNQFEKEQACLLNLKKQNISGLIVETTKSALPNPNLSLYRQFIEHHIPVLFMHGCYKGFATSSIYEDDVEAGYMAARHLIELGHTKIGGIFKTDDIQGHLRYEGFQKAHKHYGIPLEDQRFIGFDTRDLPFKFKNETNDFLVKFIDNCTGVVCYNDQISVKLIDIIRDKKIAIPEKLSLVSFDDSDLAVASEVKLTTVAHPKEKLGEEAGKLILKMIEKPGFVSRVKMKPKLVVRNSSGPAV